MEIGILGGTFDPVHLGHLAMAEGVLGELGLEAVVFVPAGQPWLKEDRAISPAVHRVEMTRLAVAQNPYFQLSTVEIERPGPSYAVDTISELKGQYGDEARLFFILGWDALAELPLWKEPSQVLRLCRLVVIPRPGWPPPDLRPLEEVLPGSSRDIVLLERPRVGISSTDIRRRVQEGQSIRHLVPGSVGRYIREHGLYTV
jgi:nicotinate-nucleotide adenylyltransferase